MQRFHPHEEPWGQFVDVKINAVETLVRQLRRATPDNVFLCSACDGWQPVESHYKLTRRCCELLLERGFTLSILTKSVLVRRDFDLFSAYAPSVRLGMTITTPNQQFADLWEPHASNVASRWATLAEAHRLGLKTSVMFGPLLPGFSDDEASLETLFQQAAEAGVDAIWFDGLNARPKVWPAVAQLLRKEFPDRLATYRRILYDAAYREIYMSELHARVASAAKKTGLADRLLIC
jgi:DNA repair photolyase